MTNDLSDERIVAIRDAMLPSQGESFDCIAFARALLAEVAPQEPPDRGRRYSIEFDGFTGTVIGAYRRLDGEEGVVLQQDGTKVVHVYRRKWLTPTRDVQEDSQ